MTLSMYVVTLIKGLNGSHVVQKCFNCLTPDDNQVRIDSAHCVEVATRLHWCCALQHCIDHASDSQRIQLATEIPFNALTLAQDPYGNYVVQYIPDLNDNRFSDAVIRQFVGNVCALLIQKFSLNVIKKCMRVAEHNTRKMLIEQLLHRNNLEKLLRNSFGNYCIQTALDYAEPTQRVLFVEDIRPILPLMKNHLQQYDGHNFNQSHKALVGLAARMVTASTWATDMFANPRSIIARSAMLTTVRICIICRPNGCTPASVSTRWTTTASPYDAIVSALLSDDRYIRFSQRVGLL
ncbi:Pumilio-family RNA binding repeat [Ceratobasidium sp. AG-Ba]|nr:Pumilio-family RNA binding repeat [Ceratobasidium sp. AG-Ba]